MDNQKEEEFKDSGINQTTEDDLVAAYQSEPSTSNREYKTDSLGDNRIDMDESLQEFQQQPQAKSSLKEDDIKQIKSGNHQERQSDTEQENSEVNQQVDEKEDTGLMLRRMMEMMQNHFKKSEKQRKEIQEDLKNLKYEVGIKKVNVEERVKECETVEQLKAEHKQLEHNIIENNSQRNENLHNFMVDINNRVDILETNISNQLGKIDQEEPPSKILFLHSPKVDKKDVDINKRELITTGTSLNIESKNKSFKKMNNLISCEVEITDDSVETNCVNFIFPKATNKPSKNGVLKKELEIVLKRLDLSNYFSDIKPDHKKDRQILDNSESVKRTSHRSSDQKESPSTIVLLHSSKLNNDARFVNKNKNDSDYYEKYIFLATDKNYKKRLKQNEKWSSRENIYNNRPWNFGTGKSFKSIEC